jgi:hypothetical protein
VSVRPTFDTLWPSAEEVKLIFFGDLFEIQALPALFHAGLGLAKADQRVSRPPLSDPGYRARPYPGSAIVASPEAAIASGNLGIHQRPSGSFEHS